MKRTIIGFLTIFFILIISGSYSAGLRAQGGLLGGGGNSGGMPNPLEATMLMSQMMAPSLQSTGAGPLDALAVGILPQMNVLMDPVVSPLIPGGITNIPLGPVAPQTGGQIPIYGIRDMGISAPGMPGFGAPVIESSMIGIPAAGTLIGGGVGPAMGSGPGTLMSFSPGPMINFGPEPMVTLGPGPMLGLGQGFTMTFGPGPVMGFGPGAFMGPVPGPMPGFGPGFMVGPGSGLMMGFGSGPITGYGPQSMMGFSPAPIMGALSGPVMGMQNNPLMPWNGMAPVNPLNPVFHALPASQNSTPIDPALNNPQPDSGREQSENRRVIFLGTTIEGIRPDGTPNIVKHYLDTYTNKRISGYSQGVEIPVPDYHWWYGCAPTSAGMMMGYFDIYGYNGTTYDLIPGGIAESSSYFTGTNFPIDRPLDPPSPIGPTLLCNKAIASSGHLADYWLSYGATGDPLASGRSIPSQFDCLADFMGTSQDNLTSTGEGNPDGQTFFYFWDNGARMTNVDLLNLGYDVYNHSGAYGMIEYTQYCGYGGYVYNQYITGYQGNTLGFSFSDYVNEIDAGRSVIIHLSGHMMLGIGYYLSTETVLVHDTWNNSSVLGPLTMPWGGTYQDPDGIVFTHYAVTCFMPL